MPLLNTFTTTLTNRTADRLTESPLNTKPKPSPSNNNSKNKKPSSPNNHSSPSESGGHKKARLGEKIIATAAKHVAVELLGGGKRKEKKDETSTHHRAGGSSGGGGHGYGYGRSHGDHGDHGGDTAPAGHETRTYDATRPHAKGGDSNGSYYGYVNHTPHSNSNSHTTKTPEYGTKETKREGGNEVGRFRATKVVMYSNGKREKDNDKSITGRGHFGREDGRHGGHYLHQTEEISSDEEDEADYEGEGWFD
ncbi:hypothetical protein ONS95_008731 [Cadophora gregata]|uniref:uncharacterized protein n=1 Tax=Cadophora gregata TaxID=51156 RepID=UPI0026DD8F33|nr:uncharacterized protein ONS95_008731 [Cadophora gregata]KAK0123722.1 hypothetical protein ONS95_008731 [Cadophora gregata]KAK0130064.1 hypothetical protein ONS96_000601 [Cadophora gregata f. sp. sojae]